MMKVTEILVPVDFSEHSERALDCAKTLAGKFDASLHLLTVVPDPYSLPNPGPWYTPPSDDYRQALRNDAGSRLSGLLTPAEHTRFRAHWAVLFGDPHTEILDYAARERIDLIVLGTHGRGGMSRVLMGSVAEKVVRTAPCPVLAVR